MATDNLVEEKTFERFIDELKSDINKEIGSDEEAMKIIGKSDYIEGRIVGLNTAIEMIDALVEGWR